MAFGLHSWLACMNITRQNHQIILLWVFGPREGGRGKTIKISLKSRCCQDCCPQARKKNSNTRCCQDGFPEVFKFTHMLSGDPVQFSFPTIIVLDMKWTPISDVIYLFLCNFQDGLYIHVWCNLFFMYTHTQQYPSPAVQFINMEFLYLT